MRQNIDEKWKTDPRRLALDKLIGRRMSDAMRVEINWLLLDYKGQPVPLKVFKYVEDWQAWVSCGLAEVIDEQVHIVGADEYAEFFAKQKTNGQKGGRPLKLVDPTETQNNPTETHSNPKNPSSSSSFSSSKKKKKEYIFSEDYERLVKKYRDRFPGTTEGPARSRFELQFKDLEKIGLLEKAIDHYGDYLDQEEWRSPKTSFANFLGTKKSGFFWEEFKERVSSAKSFNWGKVFDDPSNPKGSA